MPAGISHPARSEFPVAPGIFGTFTFGRYLGATFCQQPAYPHQSRDLLLYVIHTVSYLFHQCTLGRIEFCEPSETAKREPIGGD